MKTAPKPVVSATYAAKNFGALVDRVREEQTAYGIESHGKVVAHMTPAGQRAPTVGEFVAWLQSRPPLPAEVLDEIEQASKELRALPARISEVETAEPASPRQSGRTRRRTPAARRR